jgi:hypothetical protein
MTKVISQEIGHKRICQTKAAHIWKIQRGEEPCTWDQHQVGVYSDCYHIVAVKILSYHSLQSNLEQQGYTCVVYLFKKKNGIWPFLIEQWFDNDVYQTVLSILLKSFQFKVSQRLKILIKFFKSCKNTSTKSTNNEK